MTILNKDSLVVSASTTDSFGASVPTTEAGLEKEASQTGIFIFSKVDYDLYLKNPAGAWTLYGSISGARESITVPWADNTAAFFKCADASATIHVHRKEGDILYDSTPENDGDDQNTLLTSAGTAAQAAQNYSFPEADGAAGQVLVTDGAGNLSFADQSGGGSGPEVILLSMSAHFTLTFTEVNERLVIPFDTIDDNSFGSDVFDTSTYKFTVPENGYYYMNCSVYQQGIDDDETNQYQVRFETNTEPLGIAFRNHFVDDHSATAHVHRLDRIYYLPAGEEVWVTLRNIGTAENDSNIHSMRTLTNLAFYKLK